LTALNARWRTLFRSFFVQAEDGIRDFHVTGVQTCALPILAIWKDVPGVLTADPRLFENVSLIERLSYLEAIEMTYYGAKVIHPKIGRASCRGRAWIQGVDGPCIRGDACGSLVPGHRSHRHG